MASRLLWMGGVIYCFLKGDFWGWAEWEAEGVGEGGAGLLRSTLIEQLVHKMDDLPQGAIRPGSSWKKEEGKGGVGKRNGVRERQDPMADKWQTKADKPGSRERDGVGRWWKSAPHIPDRRHRRGRRQPGVI